MGRAKSRLANAIGAVDATRFARLSLATALARLAAPRRWTLTLAVTPTAALASRLIPPRVARMPQVHGDLGRRMQAIFVLMPPGPVVIIGSDIPGIDQRDIAAAFRALGRADAVIGPATDGGYWLIGMARTRRLPRPFAGVRWSTAHARADTLRGLAQVTVEEMRMLADVDDAIPSAAQALVARRVHPAAHLQPDGR